MVEINGNSGSETPQIKRCNNCGELKSLNGFHRDKSKRDGHHTFCKICRRASHKDYYARNADKIRKRANDWYWDNIDYARKQSREYGLAHREERDKRVRRWVNNNPERRREIYMDSYQRNFDARKESERRWREKDPRRTRELGRQCGRRRRAHKLNAVGDHALEQFKILCELVQQRCLCCGAATKLEEDHIIPLSKGGSDYIQNIQPLCRSCNSSKGIKTISYWPTFSDLGIQTC